MTSVIITSVIVPVIAPIVYNLPKIVRWTKKQRRMCVVCKKRRFVRNVAVMYVNVARDASGFQVMPPGEELLCDGFADFCRKCDKSVSRVEIL